MSGSHKLYNYELKPPEDAWKKISKELGEMLEYQFLSQKLQMLEISPPALAWIEIANTIDEERSFDQLSQKMVNIEAIPPLNIWNRIESILDYEMPRIKPIVAKKTNLQWLKYAMAACVIGLLGFLGYKMFESSNKDTAHIIATLDNKKNNTPRGVLASNISPIIKKPATPRKSIKADNATTQLKTALGNIYTTTVEKNKEIQGRYIALMTADGNVVRISKKLCNIADCIAGETENASCDEQVSQWQDQIAQAPVSETPDNFLGLLELANVESNKKTTTNKRPTAP